MPLPPLNSDGDLPTGVHRATLAEVLAHFGGGSSKRREVAARLVRVHDLADATGKLYSLVVFGSFVTGKAEPNDVDAVLVMRDEFRLSDCDEFSRPLFDHAEADREFGASVFWIRPANLILETLGEFISHWQVKRDGTKRGIVEVRG